VLSHNLPGVTEEKQEKYVRILDDPAEIDNENNTNYIMQGKLEWKQSHNNTIVHLSFSVTIHHSAAIL
jgi:hypothetical protein